MHDASCTEGVPVGLTEQLSWWPHRCRQTHGRQPRTTQFREFICWRSPVTRLPPRPVCLRRRQERQEVGASVTTVEVVAPEVAVSGPPFLTSPAVPSATSPTTTLALPVTFVTLVTASRHEPLRDTLIVPSYWDSWRYVTCPYLWIRDYVCQDKRYAD